jgi:hypothetical protein
MIFINELQRMRYKNGHGVFRIESKTVLLMHLGSR